MQLTFYNYFIIILIFFSLLSPTLHAKTDNSFHNKADPSDKKLRIGVPVPYGFDEVMHVERNDITNKTIVRGYCADVFHAAIRGLPYKIDYEFIPFINETGNMSGTYEEFVYQIYLKKYDAVVGDVTITANRSKYVDFTLPFSDIGVGTLVKIEYQKDMWIFLKPLNKNLWLTTFGFFIFTGFIVWILEKPSNSEFQGSSSQQIATLLYFTFSTLVFSNREKMTSNLSKFVVIVWVFAVFVLTSSYTATLTSLLTVQQIQQTTTRGAYIGYQYRAFYEQDIVHKLFDGNNRLQSYRSTNEYAEALSKGSKNGGVDVIVEELPYLKLFLSEYPDGYTLIKHTPLTNGFGFAFARGSPLVFDVSREIAKLRESGELMQIEERWLTSRKSTLVNDIDSVKNNPKILDCYSFSGLFLITGLSSTLALIVFLFPKLYRYITNLVKICVFIFVGGEILPVYNYA